MSRLYVGSLSYHATIDDLYTYFGKVGTVKDAVVVTDRETREPRGFGFVTMATEQEADHAVREMEGQEISGRRIRVNIALARDRDGGPPAARTRSPPPRPGSPPPRRDAGREYRSSRDDDYGPPRRESGYGEDRYDSRDSGYRSSRDSAYGDRNNRESGYGGARDRDRDYGRDSSYSRGGADREPRRVDSGYGRDSRDTRDSGYVSEPRRDSRNGYDYESGGGRGRRDAYKDYDREPQRDQDSTRSFKDDSAYASSGGDNSVKEELKAWPETDTPGW